MSGRRGYRRAPDVPPSGREAAGEVDRELEFHLEMRIRELRAGGLSEEEARREAERRFGDLAGARRRLRADAARAARRAGVWALLGELGRDVLYAVRGLRGSPGYAVVAVATLALGMGATTAIFSVVNAVLLRPLPYAAPDRLVSVWEVTPEGDDHNIVSPGNYSDWRGASTSFDVLAAYANPFSVGLTGGNRPAQVSAARATPNLLTALAVGAHVGRVFTEDDAVTGTEMVAVLSHGFWQRRYGGDRDIVGTTVFVSEQPVRIVGVLPADFGFFQSRIDVMIPLRLDAEDRQERQSHQFRVVGLLAPGVSIERAESELSGLAAGLAERYPAEMQGWGVHVTPYRDDLVRNARPAVLILMAAVALVLLIACANVAGLLVARGLSRRREMAVRAALGAGRARLLRHVLAEGAVLATFGGVVGLLLVFATIRTIVGFGPADIPLLSSARVDGGVLGFAAGTVLIVTFLLGTLPALQTVDSGLESTLRDSARASGRGSRARGALLVLEVALSVMLMIGSGLLIRSLVGLQAEDPGFDTDGLLAVSLDLPFARYPDRPQQRAFYTEVLDRIQTIPGLQPPVGTAEPPVIGYNNTFSFEIEGRPRPGPNPRQEPATLKPVTHDYFRRLPIPIVAGRAFTDRDNLEAPPVAIVNETMASSLWPEGDAVGSRIRRGEDQDWIEVVGVAGDTRHFGLEQPFEPSWYIPYEQAPWPWMSWMTVLVRADGGDPLRHADALEQAVWSVDPDLPIHRVALVADFYAQGLARRRFITVLLGAFAALALVLGAVGLYGVLSYSVARRTREFGVRLALGASPSDVAASVLRQGLALTALGLIIGTVAALAFASFMQSLLWGVGPLDPLTIAAVSGVLIGTATLACWLPARNATRADPIRALRAS